MGRQVLSEDGVRGIGFVTSPSHTQGLPSAFVLPPVLAAAGPAGLADWPSCPQDALMTGELRPVLEGAPAWPGPPESPCPIPQGREGLVHLHPSFLGGSAGGRKGVLQLEVPGRTPTLQRSHRLPETPGKEDPPPSLGHPVPGALSQGEEEDRSGTCGGGGSHRQGGGEG